MSNESYIPVDFKRLVNALDADPQTSSDGKLREIARLLHAIVHFESSQNIERLLDLYRPLAPDTDPRHRALASKDSGELDGNQLSQQVDELRRGVEELLHRSRFVPITQDDMDYAMQENHVFDLPVEIDWDKFDGDVLIYVRMADRDVLEGRFFLRKLPGYLLRGSMGNLLIGLLLLALGWFGLDISQRRDGVSQMTLGPAIEQDATLGAASQTEFSIQPDPLHEGERIAWDFEVRTADDRYIPLPASGEYGSLISIDAGRAGYRSPDQIPGDHFDLIVRAQHLGPDGAVLGKYSSRTFAVDATWSPLEIRTPLEIISWGLITLGTIGVLIACWNWLRKLRWDDERRRSVLAGDTTSQRLTTTHRNSALRIDRARDLFRREAIPGDMYRQVVIFFKLKDEHHVTMKLFKDVPLADLELIFPNMRPRMKIKDRIMMLASAAFAGFLVFLRIAAIAAAAVFTFGLGTLIALISAGGLASRTWERFRGVLTEYSKTLSESLYYKILDNNYGVLHLLADSATRQELKELVLCAGMLAASEDSSQQEIDALNARARNWLKEQFGTPGECLVDLGAALERLRSLKVINQSDGQGVESRLDLDAALAHLRQHWLQLLEPNNAQS